MTHSAEFHFGSDGEEEVEILSCELGNGEDVLLFERGAGEKAVKIIGCWLE